MRHSPATKLDAKKLKKKFSLKALLTDAALSGVVGTALGAGSFLGLNYLGNTLTGTFRNAEREIRELSLDVKELSGSLENKLVEERKKLEQQYTEGALQIYEELGIATPAETKEIETIIKNYEEFEKHYDFAERAKTFKDRIDRKLLTLDEKLESYQPEVLRGVNDQIRKLFGKPTGEKGKEFRKDVKTRLDSLCAIYDVNSDNRKAQAEVLKTINRYLQDSSLSDEEKALYSFLKDQHTQAGNEDNIRNFIQDYGTYSERQATLLQLRESITEAEEVYGKIRENKQYITGLQGLLKEGIDLKQKVREKSAGEVTAYKKQIDNEISSLQGAVKGVVTELKRKGYDIETREDAKGKQTYSTLFERQLHPLINAASIIMGVAGAMFTFRELSKGRKMRALNKALEYAVNAHNSIVDNYTDLTDSQSSIGLEKTIPSVEQSPEVGKAIRSIKSSYTPDTEIHKNSDSSTGYIEYYI
ncbi:MAG: hypothetical protein RL557_712 [archaeon]|jgi:hypothetical protein